MNIVEKLKADASQGADLSPGDPVAKEALEKLNELAGLLVESWDALSAVVKTHHLRLYNISPTLVKRIETAIEPWKAP